MATQEYAPSHIRNVVLVGHGGSGKTSLAEALLFLTGATNRLGSTLNSTSILDYEPEEHKRQGSIATSLAWVEHEGHKINILDTPGDQNFIFDSFNAMRGADAAIIVVSAPDGVEVQTERVYHEARKLGLPVVFFINKMDRERADPEGCLSDLKEVLGVNPISLQLPIGKEQGFKGLVSLFARQAYMFSGDSSGKYEKTDVPADMRDAAEEAWLALVEAVASTDDALLEKYLETFELTQEETRGALHTALKQGDITPVLYGSATHNMGGSALLDVITWAFPSPLEHKTVTAKKGDETVEITPSEGGPFLAQIIRTSIDEFSGKTSIFRIFSGSVPADGAVTNTSRGAEERLGALFALRGQERAPVHQVRCGDIVGVAKLKDTHTGDTLASPGSDLVLEKIEYPEPMMSYVIQPGSKNAEGKLKQALERLLDEDPTLSTSFEELTHHIVLQGMGQAHLDMAVDRMRRKSKIEVTTSLPPVPYRETIKKRVDNVEGKHKKQTGGAGQYGVCYLNVEPLPSGAGFEFVDNVVGGAIPRALIPSIEKGIRNRMKNGFLAGYPLTDFRVEVIDGKYHPVDSKDVAFQMAGSKGLRAAFEKGGTTLLEPIYELEIVVPTESMGDIMGDMTGRRGRVLGMDQRGRNTVIKAICPLAEILRYAPELRGMTGGKGTFTMKLHSYEPVPPHMLDKVVNESPFRKDHHEED